MMGEKITITEWEETSLSGAKRANIGASDWLFDWFVGFGKDEGCQFEGTWWDMICFARNILASPNTKKCAPNFYHPEYANDNYCGEDCPYDFAAEPVRHARWVKDSDGDEYCENCSRYMPSREVTGDPSATNYCPNCGADMRGTKDE